MNTVLKRALIAAVLIAVCAVILAATRRYGVWIIIGIAVVLFILGLLGKGNAPGKGGIPGDPERQPGKEENH
jgi:hypothetical protein